MLSNARLDWPINQLPTMSLDFHHLAATRIDVPVSDLVGTALSRLQRQKQYARVLERGGNRTRAMRDWLAQAADCITSLSDPVIALKPVTATATSHAVRIGGQVELTDPDLQTLVSSGGQVTLYLVTLGFAQSNAFDWLDGDYGAHHIQSDLSNEVLFALGRTAHRLRREATPNARLKRISVQASDLCGQRKIWDPAKVLKLLGIFGPDNPGVKVTDTGCFQPLNTLLGLTVRL